MPTPFQIIDKLNLPQPLSVIHIGASLNQEIPIYQTANLNYCLLIQAIPSVFEQLQSCLKEQSTFLAIKALCANINDEEILFNIANDSDYSSIYFINDATLSLDPNLRYIDSFKMTAKTLDSIVYSTFDSSNTFQLLVINASSAELKILMGSHNLLSKELCYLYLKVSEQPLYQGGCTLEEVTSFLKLYGYNLKYLSLVYKGFGDAFYVKDTQFNLPQTTANIALNKPASQSSLSRWSKPDDAQGAVNGTKTGKYGFCTRREANPWWQVDLLSVYNLTEVRIYNRIDRYRERVKTLRVLVSSDAIRWEQIYDHGGREPFGGVYGNQLILWTSSTKARYIRLQLSETNCLHLDEVEVYGHPTTEGIQDSD